MKGIEGRLGELEARYSELSVQLAEPDAFSDLDRVQRMAQEQARLREIVETGGRWRAARKAADEAEAMTRGEQDADLVALAEDEVRLQRCVENEALTALHLLLLPSDPNDERDVVVEIRSAAGGDEAAIWAADLFRMYIRYAEAQRWRIEVLNTSESGTHGFKEVIFEVNGRGAYSKLKFESGVHRVQRVPETESQGRIHTSTATVAVLPEADEVEVEVNEGDLKIDVYRSTGPGGQSVNTTDSAVRITHLPTGLVVTCQDEKSQHKNKAKALRVLRARLYDLAEAERQAELTETRRSMVKRGDRSDKVRTYNFPQSRITDHRIDLTTHQLQKVMDGELGLLVEPLMREDEARRLLAETLSRR